MTKRAALLARVSTPGQAREKRYGIPIQLETGRAYADRNDFSVEGTYVDQISGVSETREAFYRLLSEAEQYEAVIIYDLFRLARSEELGHRFLRLLREAGLEVHSSTRGLVLDGIQTSIEIAMSAEERRKIAARTYSGLLAKARKGLIPTSIQLYGYRDIPGTGRVMIDPDEAEIIRMIFSLGAEGASYYEIARQLNALENPRLRRNAACWYPGHLPRIIRQRAYMGEFLWPATSKKGTPPMSIPVPAIVDSGTWAAAQKRKVGRPPLANRLLVGHIRCGLCGSRISSTVNKTNGYIYRCNRKTNFRDDRCRLPSKNGRTLENMVDKAVRETLLDSERVQRILADAPPPEDPNATARAVLAEKDARWLEAFKLGAITAQELSEYRAEIRAELRGLVSPDQARAFPVEKYARAAREMPLRELLEFADVMVILTQDTLEVTLGSA